MAAASWFAYTFRAYFSHPKSDRQLYRLAKQHRIARIVEVGVRAIEQTVSLIEVAQRFAPDHKVAYTGLDWFDARPAEQSPLTLKQAHASLQSTGAQVRLVPGEPARALASVANAHANTQLLLLSNSVTDEELERAWFYVPRMLRAESLVLRERLTVDGVAEFRQLSVSELADRVERAVRRRAA